MKGFATTIYLIHHPKTRIYQKRLFIKVLSDRTLVELSVLRTPTHRIIVSPLNHLTFDPTYNLCIDTCKVVNTCWK